MVPRKLKVALAFMTYSGNGATPSETPEIRRWHVQTVLKCQADPRISEVIDKDWCDTPVPMVRNDQIGWAREQGADVLVTVDSDNTPDVIFGLDPNAKRFFDSSFDFLYDHYERGPVMIGAPYCGPPMQANGEGTENVYVFIWRNFDSTEPTTAMKLDQFTREEAAQRTGIEPVAALPTGCIMYDLRVFDYLPHPYFSYEYQDSGSCCSACGQRKPGPERKKASTEDVVTTRNIALNAWIQRGYQAVYCNWDAWAGHIKPRTVGKPRIITTDTVGAALKAAVEHGVRSDVRVKHVHGSRLPVHPANRDGVPKVILSDIADIIPEANGHAEPLPSQATHFETIVRPQQTEDGKQIIYFHPDDPRLAVENQTQADLFREIANGRPEPNPIEEMARAAEAQIKDPSPIPAFQEAQNTNGFDLDFLCDIAKNEARESGLANRTLRIVELGSWVGKSAVAMANAIEQLSDYEIHCIDNFKGGNAIQRKVAGEHDVYAEFCKNAGARLSKQIIPHRANTDDCATVWNLRDQDKKAIDLLFIDADHSYEQCKRDILNWSPFVRHNGIICGHDYNSLFPGVKKAVHEVFGWDVGVLGTVWAVRKDRLCDDLFTNPDIDRTKEEPVNV